MAKAKRRERRVTRKQQPKGIRRLIRETTGELRKVTWPTRQEALSLTRVVIIVMIVMSALLGGLDWLFFRFFTWFLGI